VLSQEIRVVLICKEKKKKKTKKKKKKMGQADSMQARKDRDTGRRYGEIWVKVYECVYVYL